MSTFEILCEHCGSRYALPKHLRDPLRGRTVTCSVCTRAWIPLTDDGALLGTETAGPAAGAPVALHPYLQSNPWAQLGDTAATPPAGFDSRPTMPVEPVATAAGTVSLRLSATGPEFEVRAIYDLGAHSFLIGRSGAHLELPQATDLPGRAIRIRRANGGLDFEGVDGYLIPIGPVSVAAGRIEPGARLELTLGPYSLTLESTTTPGSAIAMLEQEPNPQTAGYLWQQTAGDEPSQTAAPPAPAPAVDVNETVRDLGALGIDTRRFSNPIDSLDVGLVGIEPPFEGDAFRITKSPVVVGRSAVDIVLADSRVSGKHAQIEVLGFDQYSLHDLASTNGTTVNEHPVSTSRLKNNDVIGFGGVRLRFVARPKKK
jgi:hypothetical protein